MKYIPTMIEKRFLDIDFENLWKCGKRIILTDLDNTLVSYLVKYATDELMLKNKELREMGFKIYIVSNNGTKRVNKFCSNFLVDGILCHALKPYTFRFKKFFKKNNIDPNLCVFIGDQILTDISTANKLKIDSILVASLARDSEKWYTTINRKREKAILKKIKKTNPKKYAEIERLNDNE